MKSYYSLWDTGGWELRFALWKCSVVSSLSFSFFRLLKLFFVLCKIPDTSFLFSYLNQNPITPTPSSPHTLSLFSQLTVLNKLAPSDDLYWAPETCSAFILSEKRVSVLHKLSPDLNKGIVAAVERLQRAVSNQTHKKIY